MVISLIVSAHISESFMNVEIAIEIIGRVEVSTSVLWGVH